MNEIIIYIHDVIMNQDFELQVNIQSNFYNLVKAYRKDLVSKCNDPPLIFERFSHLICDNDVSFESLGIESGMQFVVF